MGLSGLGNCFSQTHRRSRTVFAINLAAAFDSADGALLPAVYGALEADLQLGPGKLGRLALYQSLAGALSLPLWGHFADRGARTRLLAFGCIAWGVITLLTGLSTNLWQLCVLRVFNGAALALINPVAGSLIADLHSAEERGRAFGVNEVCKVFGALLGAVAAGKSQDIFGSWRAAFYGYSVLAMGASLCVFLLAVEPDNVHNALLGGRRRGTDSFVVARTVCRSGTFRLVVLHGLFGAIPYHALGFLTLWFQSGGTTDAGLAALLASSMRVGNIFGNLLGGKLGDASSRWSPQHGRVCVAQLADVIRLPLVYLLFGAPGHGLTLAPFLLFLIGLVAPWVNVGANRPILSEIVPSNMRARVFAYQLALEGISASFFGAPLVGWLAENVYHYKRPPPGSTWELKDHQALGTALYDCVMIPWLVCACLFSLIHFTYPKERNNVLAARQRDETIETITL